MSSTIKVTVHSSQFPESVRESLGESLRSRRIAPKFLYESYKQAQLWMALHRACSPAWLDPDCALVYHKSYEAAAGLLGARVEVIGLGCGDGRKEANLLALLAGRGKETSFIPCDVSLPLLLTAAKPLPCKPLLCDLALASDLAGVLNSLGETGAPRIITFFGLIPNFEPEQIMPKLAAVVRPTDFLLLSANLAPGQDYRAGVQRVLPGYDNAQTRAWLRAFLEDLGASPDDGDIEFSIEETAGLLRIAGNFCFACERELIVHSEHFLFQPGDVVRLFFSYRHTPETIRQLLQTHDLQIVESWITKSGEEGVFLCGQRAGKENL